MQGLLDYPRAALLQQNVVTLLQESPTVQVSAGLEFYSPYSSTSSTDPQAIMKDVSDILVAAGSTVDYDNTAAVSGTATLMLDPAVWSDVLGNPSLTQSYAAPGSIDGTDLRLYWGNPRTRLRPYMTLSAAGVSARFYLGVYIPATPTASMEFDQPLYSVTCYDQTSIFDVPITQSITYPSGTPVLAAVQALIAQFQINTEPWMFVNVDPSRQYGALINPLSWGIDASITYLDVINEMLATIGYDPMWADCYGSLQLTPFVDPRTRAADWVFDQTDPAYSIVDPTGTWSPDIWQIPNTWLFLQNGLLAPPTEGNGQYTYTNQSLGPASIDKQLGRVLLSYHALDATSQADLVTQGNATVVSESLPAESFSLPTSPFPMAGHKDVLTYISDNIEPNLFAATGPTNSRHCSVASWSLPLDGTNMVWTMGTVG